MRFLILAGSMVAFASLGALAQTPMDCNAVLQYLQQNNYERIADRWDQSWRKEIKDRRESSSNTQRSMDSGATILAPIPATGSLSFDSVSQKHVMRDFYLDHSSENRGQVNRTIIQQLPNPHTDQILKAWTECMSGSRKGIYAHIVDGDRPKLKLWYTGGVNDPDVYTLSVAPNGLVFSQDPSWASTTIEIKKGFDREIVFKRVSDSEGGFLGGSVDIDAKDVPTELKRYGELNLPAYPNLPAIIVDRVEGFQTGFLTLKHKRNDRDFGGAPHMSCIATLRLSKNAKVLELQWRGYAQELGGDKTRAEGKGDFTVYRAPSGFKIRSFGHNGQTSSKYWKGVSKSTKVPSGPVSEINRIVGDTHGPESGTVTGYALQLRPIEIVLEAERP